MKIFVHQAMCIANQQHTSASKEKATQNNPTSFLAYLSRGLEVRKKVVSPPLGPGAEGPVENEFCCILSLRNDNVLGGVQQFY